ncbi:MAG: glycosyltransferase family 9 protein [Proteobacteria bacterium]|nr:glycosyltransferase family 9 protein [Pseudomonadota bacterium]
MHDQVNKILFISLSNIGDAIMTTPVLQALHECYPEAVIDIVGDQRSSEIFKHCPFRGRILHKQKQKFLRGGPSLLKDLWFQSYDLIVDIRTDGLAYLIPAGKRYTKFNRKLNRKSTGPHAVQQHMGIISELFQGDPPQCRIWLGDAEKKFAEEALGKYYGKRLLGLGIGANAERKIWPKNNYLSLLEKSGNYFDAIVFLGDDRDKECSDFISSRTERPCINLCGKTNILQAFAVQTNLDMFIGNDSGLGHMASAADIPTITLFGEGDPDRYRPWGGKSVWLQGQGNKLENIKIEDVLDCLK